MEEIIKNIAESNNAIYSTEEITWFNGVMNVPLKTYCLNINTPFGKLTLNGEYRRNAWKEPNWYKSLYDTDIYLWSIKIEFKSTVPAFTIKKNSWFKVKLLNAPILDIQCNDLQLKKSLLSLSTLNNLLAGKGAIVPATINCSGKMLSTNFNTLVDHKILIEKAIQSFIEIENVLKQRF